MKFTKDAKFLVFIAIVALIGILYRLGYDQAIRDAKLISVNENTHQSYTLTFDKRTYTYAGDWIEKYTD